MGTVRCVRFLRLSLATVWRWICRRGTALEAGTKELNQSRGLGEDREGGRTSQEPGWTVCGGREGGLINRD